MKPTSTARHAWRRELAMREAAKIIFQASGRYWWYACPGIRHQCVRILEGNIELDIASCDDAHIVFRA